MKLIITDLTDFAIPVEGEHRIIGPRGEIHPCAGCFGCWVKTPGQCVIRDGYGDTGAAMAQCDQAVLVSRCYCGSPSPFVKAVQDRAISYVHPDFEVRRGKLHHKRRYKNTITLSAWFYGPDITAAEQETARSIIEANAVNLDAVVGEVRFFASPAEMEGMTL